MDAPYYNGSDNRDSLAPDYERDDCQDCGARADEPCAPDCGCAFCRKREFATQDATPKDAA